nr:NAD(P)-dependent oxidoreductase [uncultured Bacillus sp.]
MDYYPVYLQLQGKKAVLIGGGKIAERKIAGLLSAGADITVISPELTEQLRDLVREGKIIWRQKKFSPDDIEGAFLIIAATNERPVNLAVKQAAAPHQFIALSDSAEQSDFILPSVIKRGKLIITVSTSGASPILAKKMKNEIAAQYGPDYREFVEFLFDTRKWILQQIKDPELKQQLLTAITEPAFLHSKNRQRDFLELVHSFMPDQPKM